MLFARWFKSQSYHFPHIPGKVTWLLTRLSIVTLVSLWIFSRREKTVRQAMYVNNISVYIIILWFGGKDWTPLCSYRATMETLHTCTATIFIQIPNITLTWVRTITVYTRGLNWTIVREFTTFIVICIKREVTNEETNSLFLIQASIDKDLKLCLVQPECEKLKEHDIGFLVFRKIGWWPEPIIDNLHLSMQVTNKTKD